MHVFELPYMVGVPISGHAKTISLSILSFSKNASEEMFLASKQAFLLKG
jgi:hypothetical protein